MFCPKCGTENSDTTKYCRACSESLLIVAQAMKKRLPVMIAGKLDAALEQSSERFRRDTFIFLICGVGMLITTIGWRQDSWTSWLNPFFTLWFFLGGGLSYLIYKRSQKLSKKLQPDQLIFSSKTDLPKSQLQILFCFACGAKAEESTKHCRSCGADLQAVREAVEPRGWRAALNSLFDNFVLRANNKSQIPQVAQAMFYCAWFFLVIGIPNTYFYRDPAYLFFSLMCFTNWFWDRTASRRWFGEDEKNGIESLADQSVPITNELALSSAKPALISITEETTHHLEPVIVQSQEDVETRKL